MSGNSSASDSAADYNISSNSNGSDSGTALRDMDLIEHPVIRRTLATLHIGAIVMSAVGNGLLIAYIIVHRRRGRRRSNVTASNLILNLAACDFVSSAINQPMRLFDMLTPKHGFEDSIEFCRASGFIALLLACVGFHTIVAISQERLLLISYPLTAKAWLTKRTTWTVLLSIWVVAFCSALPFPILFSYRINIQLPTYTYNFCTIDVFKTNFYNGRYYYIFIFVSYYAFPLAAVTVSYARVFYSLSSTSAYGSSVRDEAVTKMLRHRKSLAWMMVAVAVSFAAFEGPFFFTFLYLSLGFRFTRNRVFVKMLIDFLPILSHVVNPAVYLARAKTFKRSIVAGSEARIAAGLTSSAGRGTVIFRATSEVKRTLSGNFSSSCCDNRCSAAPKEILLDSSCSQVLSATDLVGIKRTADDRCTTGSSYSNNETNGASQ